MLSADAVAVKKKKKKKVNIDDGTIVKKKKKKVLNDSDVIIKSKKKKKKKADDIDEAIISSTLRDADEEEKEEDNNFPASQSPVLFQSPQKEVISSKTPLYHSPVKTHPCDDITDLPSPSPKKKSPKKRAPTSSFPIKFAKKTKIIPDEDARIISEDSDSLSIDVDKDSDLEGPPSSGPPAQVKAPITDVIISPDMQDLRDLALITEVDKMFGNKTDESIDWGHMKIFNLTPADAAARYHELTCHISRIKSVSDVASEFYRGFCVRRVEERVPLTQRNLGASRGEYGTKKTKVKKMNAFMIFSSEQDKNALSKEEIRSKWDLLNKQEKHYFQAEAKKMNILNGLVGINGKKQVKGKVNAYSLFTKDQMLEGIKMAEIGAKWRELSDDVKEHYRELAAKTNEERALEEAGKQL